MSKRDHLLIQAGRWAGLFSVRDDLYFPSLLDPSDDTNEFIADAVADYIMSGSSDDFDEYICDLLKEEYGVISTEEAKKIENSLYKANTRGTCETCLHDLDNPATCCTSCDWGEKWQPKESDS